MFVSKVIAGEIIQLLILKAGVSILIKKLIKFIPIAGQIVSAGISYGAMEYLGTALIDDCYEVCRMRIIAME